MLVYKTGPNRFHARSRKSINNLSLPHAYDINQNMRNGTEQRAGISLSDFSAEGIAPGLVVNLESASQLNDLMILLAKSTKFTFSTQYGNIIEVPPRKKISDVLENRKIEKKFFGPLRKFRITILPEDTSFIKNPENIVRGTALTFLAEADIYSSGRGKAGEVHLLCSFYIRNKKMPPNNDKTPHVLFSNQYMEQAISIPSDGYLSPESRKIWSAALHALRTSSKTSPQAQT